MGSLIPNTDDGVIIDQLNKAFSEPKLARLRAHIHAKQDDMFANNKHLHRISWRLKVWPTSSNRPKGRWFTFLKTLLDQNSIPPDRNRLAILNALQGAVSDWDPPSKKVRCVAIRFWARYEPALATDYDIEVIKPQPDANGQYVLQLTLLCNHEIDPAVPGDPSKPSKDNGEKLPEQPNLTRIRRRKSPAKTGSKNAQKKKSTVSKASKRSRR